MSVTITTLDSPGELALRNKLISPQTIEYQYKKRGSDSFTRSWCGGINREEALRMAISGDESNVPRAQALMDKIVAQVQSQDSEWTNDIYGSYPCVPGFIAGVPDHMKRRTEYLNEKAPVRIFAPLGASSDVSPQAMEIRGIAVLALVLELQKNRSVQLYAYHGLKDHGRGHLLLIKINTKPLDLASTSFCLTHPAFMRHLSLPFFINWLGRWSSCPPLPMYEAIDTLGITKQDVFLPRLNKGDTLPDPARWVNGWIEKLNKQD